MSSFTKSKTDDPFFKDSVVEEWMEELIDDVTCGLCFEIHRSCKKGYFLLDESDPESQKQYQIVNKKGLDVFGQPPNIKKQVECTCPNCHRNLAASRFAPHLEKCMGMGRISSRIASRRIASGTQMQKKMSDHEGSGSEDEEHYKHDKKAKRIKKDRGSNSSKKKKKSKQSADNSPHHSSTSNTPTIHQHNDDDNDYLLDI